MSKAITKESPRVGTLAELLPDDLARVGGQGVAAIESFLSTRNSELSNDEFRRAFAYARIGAAIASLGIRLLGVLNNREALALARLRLSAEG